MLGVKCDIFLNFKCDLKFVFFKQEQVIKYFCIYGLYFSSTLFSCTQNLRLPEVRKGGEIEFFSKSTLNDFDQVGL